jgi:dTDP-4-amino-4,6-dideoxygalactose transaminase
VTGLELAVGDGPMGGNHCMTEFQAALLLAQLPGFDQQIAHAAANAAWLDRELPGLGRMRALEHPPRLTRRTVYEYIISFEPEIVEDLPISRIGEALTAETGTPWYPSDPPLHTSGLYRPGSKRRFAAVAGDVPSGDQFPVATDFARRSLVCHHSVLLASRASMQSIVDAFAKVLTRLDDLRDAERG